MSFSANSPVPSESTIPISSLSVLGAELIYTQEATGSYLSFYWQEAEARGIATEILSSLPRSDNFAPVETTAYLEQIQRILTTSSPEKCCYVFSCNQQVLAFELVISPILLPNINATTVLAIGRQIKIDDVTKSGSKPETHIQSQARRRTDQSKKLLTQIARNIRRTLDLDTIWQQTVDSLGEALEVSRCIIYPYKPDYVKVSVVAEYSRKQVYSMLGLELAVDTQPLFCQAISTLEPVIDAQSITADLQPQSVLVIATCYQDQPNGLIGLYQYDRHREWTISEIELVRELAEQVGTAIAHATLYKELEKARHQAEEASRLKSEFLANTSHEIRTPLNGMIGFLKLILEGMADDPQEQMEFIEEAYNSALHLLNIMNDILDIAKIEAGKLELELGPIKLDELFNDVRDFSNTQAEQKNLNLQIHLPVTPDEIIIYGNYQRLLQVMLNLVSNAVKFTHEGGITISADVVAKKIVFQNQELPGMVKIRVADTGIGVSLDKQDKLFQSFSQVDGSRTRQYGGTGLGLTISQKLVEAMGGTVNFYSMGEGLGSTVTFTVPLYQQPVMALAPRSDSHDHTTYSN